MTTAAAHIIATVLLIQPPSKQIMICNTIEPIPLTAPICADGANWFNGERGYCVICTRHKRYPEDGDR